MEKQSVTKDIQDFAGHIFDLDGTLAESLHIWQKIDEIFLERRGFVCDASYLQAVRVLRFPEAAEYTIKRFALQETAEAVMQEWRSLALEEYSHSIELKPGAADFLRTQKARGVRLALCTASERGLVEPLLRRHQIGELFEGVICATEHEPGKIYPAIWRHTAQLLGLAAEDCLVFEDALAPMRAAAQAGCATLIIEDEHACHERGELLSEADFYVQDYAELTALFN